MTDVIHQLVRDGLKISVGRDMHTRCGIVACVETFGAFVVQMIDEKGGDFKATHQGESVTCRKCINLTTTGNIHGKPSARRPLDTDRATHASRRRRNKLTRACATRTARGA